MNIRKFLLALLLTLTLVASPVFAQDETPTAVIETVTPEITDEVSPPPVVIIDQPDINVELPQTNYIIWIVGLAVVAVIVMLFLRTFNQVLTHLYNSIPVSAQDLVQHNLPVVEAKVSDVFDQLRERAAKTETTFDDFLVNMTDDQITSVFEHIRSLKQQPPTEE